MSQTTCSFTSIPIIEALRTSEQSVDVGGTAPPGLTLETAKEHTGVSCGWPDARDAC